MKLRYQARLTLIAAASAGMLIGLIFAAFLIIMAGAEKASLDRDIHLGMDELIGEMRELPSNPAVHEVVQGHPGLSVAIFGRDGTVWKEAGPVALKFGEDVPHHISLRQREGDHIAEVSLSSRGSERRVSEFAYFAAILWPVLTFAFTVVIWLSGKWMFSPLSAMAHQAASLDESQLSFRLPKTYGGEYDEFTDKLNDLLSRIETSARRQEQFAYDAAHELRTPLTILSAHLQEQLRREDLSAADQQLFPRLLEEFDRLTTLVNMLLESAKMKSNLTPASANMAACLESSAARWLDRYTERHIEIQVETSPGWVAISSSELETVLDNLLSNSLRASSANQTVRISNRRQGDREIAMVEDQGSGIPQDRIESIFAPFVRLDTGRNRLHGGVGLGLSICKRLIEDRGGTISVSEAEGGGSVFQIELPSGEPDATPN